MRIWLTKKQKIMAIYFDERRFIEVQTHNTDFKKAANGICGEILTILLPDRR